MKILLFKIFVVFYISTLLLWVFIDSYNDMQLSKQTYKEGFVGQISTIETYRGKIKFTLGIEDKKYLVYATNPNINTRSGNTLADFAKVGDSIVFNKTQSIISLIKKDSTITFIFHDPYK